MIITQLSATNFGKHEKIHFSTHEAVVGIIGPNGSGKSTLLKLLQFLFTSILEDEQSSYIRNEGKFAEGEAEFIKDGQKGKITRRITASRSTRRLEWNGETYVKEADVEARLAEILGADKHAINNAVFIPQGDLDKILFGPQADREKLFTRLVNVAFLERTVAVLDAKIKAESANTEDLTAVVDELRAQLAQAGGHVQDLDIEYRTKPDVSPALSYLRALHDHHNRVEQTSSRQAAAKQAADQHNRNLRATLDSSGFASWEALQAKETELSQDRRRFEISRDRLLRGKHVLDLSAKRRQDLLELRELKTRQRQQLTLCQDMLQGTDLQALYQRVQQLERRKRLVVELDQAKQATAAAMKAYTVHCQTQTVDISPIAPWKEELSRIDATLGGLTLSIDALEAVAGHKCGNLCPVCQQTITPEIVSQDRLKALRDERSRQTAAQRALHARIVDLEHAAKTAQAKMQTLSADYLNKTKQSTQLQQTLAELPEGDLTQEQARYQQLIAQDVVRRETQTALTSTEARQLELEGQRATPEDEAAAQAYTTQALMEANENYQRCQDALQKLVSLRGTVGHLWQAAAKAEAEAATAHKDWSEATFKLHQHQAAATESALSMLRGADIPLKLTELEGQERVRQECQGRLTQARQQLSILQKRDQELQERLHKNSIRMQVVEDLRRLREVFSRGGLPMIYVDYQFRRLTTLAQRNLSDLGANFAVAVNDERPVAFTFRRLDEADGTTMDMSKLSGGQRVKLAVAFLIAVQQLLIPEVGLLVLDEPSTHLDEESVEALKGLLMNMTQTLQNASHQVWVVDHHTALQPAFGACLQLGAL
jgi:DNA repair protein SbcC/Rad50